MYEYIKKKQHVRSEAVTTGHGQKIPSGTNSSSADVSTQRTS
jgi:hypothetical protein